MFHLGEDPQLTACEIQYLRTIDFHLTDFLVCNLLNCHDGVPE